jgi:hypothetical protein
MRQSAKKTCGNAEKHVPMRKNMWHCGKNMLQRGKTLGNAGKLLFVCRQ